MKTFKLLPFIISALITFGPGGTALAFHDGGVAYCEGCHTMHNSESNLPVTTTAGATQFNGHAFLLTGSDQSSTCLNCHASNDSIPTGWHIMSTVSASAVAGSFVPQELTPGGDFAWLKVPDITYSITNAAGITVSETNRAIDRGHNIVAADFGLIARTDYTLSPGGNYPTADLYCSSCHDPHGRYRIDSTYTEVVSAIGKSVGPIIASGSYGTVLPGNGNSVGVYRLLGGVGYLPDSLSGTSGAAFTQPSPFAFAPADYNRSESLTDTRVAYGYGMAEWCSNCHASIHNPNYPTTKEHPTGEVADALLSITDSSGVSIAQKYNAYVNSGNLTGTQSTSYLSLVPYEEGLPLNQANYADLATRAVSDGSKTTGPITGKEVVMCLSCHRAHASAWFKGARWNTQSEFLVVQGEYPGIDASGAEAKKGDYNLGYTQAQVQQAFYGRQQKIWAAYQRQLCNKCHAKD